MDPQPCQAMIRSLTSHWGWIENYVDSQLPSQPASAGKLVTFRRLFDLDVVPATAYVRLSADTRYKLVVNGIRAGVGPARGYDSAWYYDTIDLAPFLAQGANTITIDVVRFYPAFVGAFSFVRTTLPGLTLVGQAGNVNLSTNATWEALLRNDVVYPVKGNQDIFLHIFERITPAASDQPTWVPFKPYKLFTRYGICAPWHLLPRIIPMANVTPLLAPITRDVRSEIGKAQWNSFLTDAQEITLPANSNHRLELQAESHVTAFLNLRYTHGAGSRLEVTYAEAYRDADTRKKGDRTKREGSILTGPQDHFQISHKDDEDAICQWEPLWWRAFRFLVIDVHVGEVPLTLKRFAMEQTNYPAPTLAAWQVDEISEINRSDEIWKVSLRTLRNCLYDGFADCPFYEQLQYVQDTRSSALFQYHVNGDDRLARQAIIAFAASISPGGVIEARFPSQGVQRITGFSLFWILQLFDHHMYFGDSKFTSKHLHIVDGILGFFDRHIGTNGLVQSHPHDHWAFVDWVTSWSDTGDCEPGTPLAGRKNGIFTYLSMLYAYALEKGSKLCQDLDRLDTAREYARRRESLLQAIKILCFDGEFFTDSLANDASASDDYSEHCQIWAVLCGATSDRLAQQKLLINSCIAPTRTFSQCSYAMKFYAMRAYSQAGIYDDIYHQMFSPWHKMLDQNLSTWEEDDVNARSDCHAWSALPIYEYLSEVSGLKPDEAGWRTMTFAPRIRLYSKMHIVVPLGDKGLAQVTWSTGQDGYIQIRLSLPSKMKVVVQLPDHDAEMHEAVSNLDLRWRET